MFAARGLAANPPPWIMSAMRFRMPPLTATAATALVVLALGAWATWRWSNVADAWMPGVATSAIAIAVTITLVQGIIRREEKRRLRPRVEDVIGWLRSDLFDFAQSAVIDYAGTHLHTFETIQPDLLSFLEQWLAESDRQDSCAAPIRDGPEDPRVPLLLHSATRFAESLKRTRERDREVMEPELVRALDDCVHGVGLGQMALGLSLGRDWHDPIGTRRHGESRVVQAALDFGRVLLRHDDRGRIAFPDLSIQAAEEHSRHLARHGESIVSWRGRLQPPDR
jgi:hypothetical protein